MTDESARDIIARLHPDFPIRHAGCIVTDTSEFMDIDHGDVIRLAELHYLVLRDEVEQRFGIEDPKYWVKRCRVLETGGRKILKLVFNETFVMNFGSLDVQCYRSPHKESRILDLVRGDMRFMQGVTVPDERRNAVRVLDIVQGRRLDLTVENIDADHRTYFHELFPDILEKYIEACEAIAFLHAHWEKHGDIRRDHLWVDYATGRYRWIDFDYAFDFRENPFGLDLFGLGNILVFLVGKRQHDTTSLPKSGLLDALPRPLEPNDFSIMWPTRLMNLRLVFPYIPESLNYVLMRYAAGSEVFYDSTPELVADLRRALEDMRRL